MKKYLLLLFTVFFLICQDQLLANTVIVRGYVKDSIGNPIVNRTVKVFTNDSSQGCIFTHTVTTNSNGYYIDSVICHTTIKNIFVKVEDCKGQWIIKNPSLTSLANVEINFIICRPNTTTPVQCKALYQYAFTETGIKFSSTPSQIALGDSIISRTWVFGDSSVKLSGNMADPWHEYKKAGTYNICLTIKTKKGCESNYCKTVVFQPMPADSCIVKINVTTEKLGARKFRFSSNATTVATGDSIIKRVWSFGDGTGHEGNEISPSKEYKDTGVYKACLKVKTKRGCEKETCIQVWVKDSMLISTACKAQFTFNIHDKTVKFNSTASNASIGDSIISRTWIFGDSSLPVTNRVDLSHTYAKAGVYSVYLYIKTKNGCESKFAAQVYLDSIKPASCKIQPQFTIARISGKKILLNSMQTIAQPGDSIISRKWSFGDGSVMDGNIVTPLKEYHVAGIYNVCLMVKTRKGCEASVCKTVSVLDSVPQVLHMIKIISLNPNPVITRLLATISSSNMNAEVEISVIDIYGAAKFSFKKTLSQGTNIVEVVTANLPKGPYFLKVVSRGSKDSKLFYKF